MGRILISNRARKVDVRLPGTAYSKSHGTRPFYYNHLDDPVDSDQQVVNKDLSLPYAERASNTRPGTGNSNSAGARPVHLIITGEGGTLWGSRLPLD